MTQSDFPNDTDHPVLDAVRQRWSPYRFDPRPVENEKLIRCLEAARWAASSFNDQPWFWIVAHREDEAEFEKVLGCLVEANQGWARHAGVLMLSVIRTTFQANQKPNRVALHDLGQAACQLSLQATELELQVHQMAGVNLSAIRQKFDIPSGHEPQTAIAIGYPATGEPQGDQEQELEDRQSGPRERRTLAQQVFTGKFGNTADFLS